MSTTKLNGWQSAPGVYVSLGGSETDVYVLTGTRKGNTYARTLFDGQDEPCLIQWNCIPKKIEQSDYDYFLTIDDALLVHTSGVVNELLNLWK